MKREDFDNLPYNSRKELIELRNYCATFFETNSDILLTGDYQPLLHHFHDITSKFGFNIRSINYNEPKRENLYTFDYTPQSLTNIKGTSNSGPIEHVKAALQRWINLVRKMHSVTEEYYNPENKFYNEEFVDFFVNNDEDSATAPFDIQRQEVLYYFLTYAENQITESNEIEETRKTELIEDIKSLKENIPNHSKKKVVSTLSKFAQKIKQASNKLFHDVFDVLKKEIIKKVLSEGAEQIPNAVKQIEGWISLLN